MRTFLAAGLLLLVAALRTAEADQELNPNTDSSVQETWPRFSLAGADGGTRRKLMMNVGTPAVGRESLEDMLMFFADRYDFKFEIDEKAFKQVGVVDVLKKEVVHPKVKKAAFAGVLADILAQVRAEFYVNRDLIVIIPKRD